MDIANISGNNFVTHSESTEIVRNSHKWKISHKRRSYLRNKSEFFKKNESTFNSLGKFLKASDQANKAIQIPLPKSKNEMGFTKAKGELFNHCYKVIVEHLNRQLRLSFRFEKKTRIASFSSKRLNITVINSILQKFSTWVTAKSNIPTIIEIRLHTSVTFLRAITSCSRFTPDCGYDNSTIILIGDLYCPNKVFG